MNIYSLLGFVLATGVLITGLKLATDDMMMFINYPSMFIVLGGTLAATAITFQLDKILILVKVFLRRVFLRNVIDYSKIIKELMEISEGFRNGEDYESLKSKSTDPLLTEALGMLNDGIMTEDKIISIIETRIGKMYNHQMEESKKIKTISKLPPAFGMMGTTIGMIVLLGNLSGTDAIKMVGPAMGVCLITTLYGLIVSNMLLLPAAENLIVQTKEMHLKREIVLQGIELIIEKTNPIELAEELNSFLQPKDRIDWREVVKGA